MIFPASSLECLKTMQDKPDKLEKAIRFGCGGMFGLFVSFYVGLKFFFIPNNWVAWLAAAVCAAFICGLFAMRRGDRFWEGIKRLWWW
jgi:hypothetical protein